MEKYEYGAMSARYELKANHKLTAYATMIVHFDNHAPLVAIYYPESCKLDSWMTFDGKISDRLDEVFGGKDYFDNYVHSHLDEIRACYKTIKKLV